MYSFQEANIMTLLEHKNIVALYGFASLQQPIMLVIEFVPGGDLRVSETADF